MSYSIFNKKNNDTLAEPMFFGNSVNVARFDKQKFEIFEKLTEKQLSFFWRPEEIDVTKDKIDFNKLLPNERHIFISNLQYQILLDSVQGRSPSIAFLPIVSLPEVENWIETWSFSETIHSRSYTHIIRAIVNEPGVVFDDIMKTDEIIKRAESVSEKYDELIKCTQAYLLHGEGALMVDSNNVEMDLYCLKKKLYLTLVSVNILEAIRFYVSFACSFAFAERKLMEGNAKIIKMIARDEALHLVGTQHMLNLMGSGKDDPDMQKIAQESKDEVIDMFKEACEQEKEWAEYLFRDGSMIGLNAEILKQYLEYITNIRMNALGLKPIFEERVNPLPWINHWLDSDSVQVAPQETEITAYLVSAIDNNMAIDDADFGDFKL
ncbi:class Ia ribonucleoside-diphosphate reductase subunit beta [bacterium endosymbiont of Bathymodiolus sp. 5 South]|jgi:ribonucleoside-diphosphate reductase beta chain|uniref:class Ia ribonucleoside-diphosphate reductase subunit beta n=1 Tax=bacterium endosymbiont of Bathymodiolus sp. 5 South TaxID=1181670 RepID=UPI0010B16826|nr:class Ia ribonucleoside-diphosphate reductase subunit beta [bacterium endosymbiont of Bathymodiolus sp. 5 South]VVH58427.1 Ribonucleotide reductase of class Ia (aerobic), beta subunit (EC [uncultured Gammaproteobacteria bacterium]SHN92017.1 Ribonucleotide reductase of class Ia (aerobic), beta subunit [bacterium endosymbiont of Bathymodiolus sp. 5 South]SSC07779.1 Ribonucleotide reductase of class Ia (aerobic), beta subunit [bacterium endosymbiont of Bathymodiolus sp. 5 South]VVH63885.1 Ribon